jgi:predicted nucleic acid-binding protein
MKYVVDASVAVGWEIPGPHSSHSCRLREDYKKQIHELVAPEAIVWETANALIKAERGKKIKPGMAQACFQDFLTTQPLLHGVRQSIHSAISLSLQTNAGLYDCMYLRLAEREKCEFFTADDRLIRILQGQLRFAFVRYIATY